MLESGISYLKEEIMEISEISSKEKGIEKILNKMKSEWKPIKFELAIYKNSDAYVIRQIEPTLEKLDEDMSKTSSILSSPFIKFLETEL